MFCPNCGESIPDGSKFCGACGANLAELMGEYPVVGVPDGAAKDALMEPPPEQLELVQPKAKKDVKKFWIIGAAVAAVAVLVLLVRGVASMLGGGGDNAFVYFANGKYELLTNLAKNTSIEIASGRNDDTYGNFLTFSPDGKYVYYYTKYDASTGAGTLSRAEYGKLKADSEKNESYIEVIATNVQLGFRLLEDGRLTYLNGDNTLYYYDGRDATQIAKSVNYYCTDKKGRLVYETGTYSDGYTLYGIYLNNPEDKIKLASNYSSVYNSWSFYLDSDVGGYLDNIFYSKDDNDGGSALYVVGFDKDAEKLGNNARMLGDFNGKFYYAVEDGAVSLYNYVQDDFQVEDAGVAEPDRDNFQIPTYSYDMITTDSTPESGYGELYTSCTRSLYWLGGSTWWSYSMGDALGVNWGDNSDALYSALQDFINKYQNLADADGYIPVTDEVKADLQRINNTNPDPTNPNDANAWLELCFEKKQTGTTTDYEAYNTALEQYNAVKDRILIREQLRNPENDYPLAAIYCYESGKISTISEGVLAIADDYNGVILYRTADMVTDKLSIGSVASIYDVRSALDFGYEAQNHYVVLETGATGHVSASAAGTMADVDNDYYVYLYYVDGKVYMNDGDDALYAADISQDAIGSFNILTDEAKILGVNGSTLYYAANLYTNNDYVYCDLYSVSGGESKRLVQDVIINNLTLYSDGAILAYTDYRGNYGFELTMVSAKGEKTRIADDVTQFIRVDKSTLLYISDEDLYSYNGKEKVSLQRDVDYVWSRNSMEVARVFYY